MSLTVYQDKCKKKKKPQDRRNYYSEVITNVRYGNELVPDYVIGTHKKINYLWQIMTERHCPVIKKFPIVVSKVPLRAAERWMSFPEDKSTIFWLDTFSPKVQLMEIAYAKELPLNVATERLRRQYAAKGLKMYLDEIHITSDDLVSKQLLKYFGLYTTDYLKTKKFLPLELFDNIVDYQDRSPENWIQFGIKKGVQNPLPAEAFVPITQESERQFTTLGWLNVAVYSYNKQKNTYHIMILDGTKREYDLPIIYVMFKAENPEKFARKLKFAVDLRNETEETLKYKYYLDCVPLDGVDKPEEKILEKILFLATRNKQLDYRHLAIYQLLEAEYILEFKTQQVDLEVQQLILTNSTLTKYFKVCDILCKSSKMYGTFQGIDTNMRDFGKMRDYFRWVNIYVIPETYRAMFLVINECMKIEQLSLLSHDYGARHLSLQEFLSIQIQYYNNLIKNLQSVWLEDVLYNIRMCIGDIGKGWFDVSVRKYDMYERAKLLRFMELVKVRMQYSLRILVQNTVDSWLNSIISPCLSCIDLKDEYEWDSADLIHSPFNTTGAALFILELDMDLEKGAFYITDPEIFKESLVKLFDNSLKLTHEIRQVHPLLLGNLNFAKDLYLSSVGLLADEIAIPREYLQLAYDKACIPVKAYAKAFNIHHALYTMNIKEYMKELKSRNPSASDYKEEISLQKRLKQNLEVTVTNTIIIGPFFIHIDKLRQYLLNKSQEIIKELLSTYIERMKLLVDEVLEQYLAIMEQLMHKPDSIEAILDIREWIETIPMSMKTLEDLSRRYFLEYEVLDHFWTNVPQEDFENKWTMMGWPYKIRTQIKHTEEFLHDEEERYYRLHQADEQLLLDKIDYFTQQVTNLAKIRDFSKCKDIAVEITKLWKQMREAQEQGQLLNNRQKLFEVPVVPFDTLTKLIKEFEPYKTLWLTANDWLRSYEMWMDNPIMNVDGESVERNVTEMYKIMIKCIRVFAEIPLMVDIATTVKEQIEAFKPLIPILLALRNPGMRQRHWDYFKEQTGINIIWTSLLTFQECLNLGVANFPEEMTTLGEAATKEYAVETSLQKMWNEWQGCKMELTPYKDTGTYIMKISDELQQMLDDHYVLTQQLSFSPFKGPFEQAIDDWETSLKLASKVIEQWMEVQKNWMYLEPILNSEDIKTQLPAESKKYGAMERTWRRIMRGAVENPLIIEYCADKKLLESLKDCNHILEIVQKGLSEYLENKRSLFPRLYFLSDDELLEILSQSKDPLRVQPHLRKCFENIAKLKFEEDLQITKMYSAEEECVDLNPTLYPTVNVEVWLLGVEQSMMNTVRTILEDALNQIYTVNRDVWVLSWPGQVVIAGCQTFWTAGVEDAILTNTMEDFLKQVVFYNLDILRTLVRGTLTFVQREILCALIVIEVHARDVTQNIFNAKINSINDFDWISQLRYYWVEPDLKVRAVNAEFQYGYEYLGNSGRLVITPLTDRCYLTLTGALHLKFGGAPAGPAGTGKTETTKDLAKAFARQCVVFNCSDQLDYMAMGKFFKGLASAGAWACFDEFNRIDIEVLSVIAQQITTIQKAQQARLDRFYFEGSEIVLKESCAVFITMNPGYAGRTELPDNLKALFRPVSMMVPDYTLISEISLFAFGFGDAKAMANKITTTFKLSSEQLSTQDHYDFGMRAVKTVITVAGNLKRERPKMDERQIVLRALRDVNVPKFLTDDLKLFNGIISDLFPKMVEDVVDYGILEKAIRSNCRELGLEDVNEFVKKVIQLYETTVVRHGLMLVGPTASGKTKLDFLETVEIRKHLHNPQYTIMNEQLDLMSSPLLDCLEEDPLC